MLAVSATSARFALQSVAWLRLAVCAACSTSSRSDASPGHRPVDGRERRAENKQVHERENTNTPAKGCLRHREEGIRLVGSRAHCNGAVVHSLLSLGSHASTGRREQLNRIAPRRVYLDENWSF